MAESVLPGLPDRIESMHDLYSSHHGWLFGCLRKKLGCSHHAADVAQDTFLRILASRDALLCMEQPRAYLTTTAKRLMLDQARRQAVEQAYLAELALQLEQGGVHPDPEQLLLAIEALDQIGAALAAASDKVRQAFVLHYLDDLSHTEIAETLGVSTRMVRKYLVQALVQCQLVQP